MKYINLCFLLSCNQINVSLISKWTGHKLDAHSTGWLTIHIQLQIQLYNPAPDPTLHYWFFAIFNVMVFQYKCSSIRLQLISDTPTHQNGTAVNVEKKVSMSTEELTY